jgi:hypothetical protein
MEITTEKRSVTRQRQISEIILEQITVTSVSPRCGLKDALRNKISGLFLIFSLYILVHYTYRFVLWLNLNVQGATVSSLYSEISAFRSQPKYSPFWGSLCHGSGAKPPEYQRGGPCSSPGHRPCGSCGRQRVNFHPSSLLFPCHYHSTTAPHSLM